MLGVRTPVNTSLVFCVRISFRLSSAQLLFIRESWQRATSAHSMPGTFILKTVLCSRCCCSPHFVDDQLRHREEMCMPKLTATRQQAWSECGPSAPQPRPPVRLCQTHVPRARGGWHTWQAERGSGCAQPASFTTLSLQSNDGPAMEYWMFWEVLKFKVFLTSIVHKQFPWSQEKKEHNFLIVILSSCRRGRIILPLCFYGREPCNERWIGKKNQFQVCIDRSPINMWDSKSGCTTEANEPSWAKEGGRGLGLQREEEDMFGE